MAGALLGSPTVFSSISIGSGHSLGGGDYAAGTAIYAHQFLTVSSSTATVVASGVSTQTISTPGFGLGDVVTASFITALPQGVSAQVWMSAASQASLALSNTSGATTGVSATTVILNLYKVAV